MRNFTKRVTTTFVHKSNNKLAFHSHTTCLNPITNNDRVMTLYRDRNHTDCHSRSLLLPVSLMKIKLL